MGVCLAEGGSGGGARGGGSGASLDAAACAASRAARRKHALMAGFEEGAAFLGDIESAEAGYEDPEEM